MDIIKEDYSFLVTLEGWRKANIELEERSLGLGIMQGAGNK